ncbi:MAG: hypothetical protein ACTS6H_00470 [Candidatus Hodgkinia cicadicola]
MLERQVDDTSLVSNGVPRIKLQKLFAVLEATNSHSCCASTSLRRNSDGVESSTILICVINLRKLEG